MTEVIVSFCVHSAEMIKIRKSNARGTADHGWLKSKHTFSFADFHDPEQMGFRVLRVINEDLVEASQGFGTHAHQNMEIISYVISGELEHKDSLGTGSVIRPGDVQYMSAGRGVTHSEFNHSKSEAVHFLQIWIQTNDKGADPRYSQIHFRNSDKLQTWRLIVSPTGESNSIAIRQDAKIFARLFGEGDQAEYALAKNRFAWAQVVKGRIEINSQVLSSGDGASIENEELLKFKALEHTEILLFDLP